MINSTLLPEELIEGKGERRFVNKYTLEGIDEVQSLFVTPLTSIKKHGHNNQWEIWLDLVRKIAYICLKGEEHTLVNNSSNAKIFMAIKGHDDYSYDDLEVICNIWGFRAIHGSLVVDD